MLAIAVLRARVAPVLDWCSLIHLFPLQPECEAPAEVLQVSGLPGHQRLELLKRKGVRILICGALSPALRLYAARMGLTLICGVCGAVDEVRRSFFSRQLDQPDFWLPGCGGPRRTRARHRRGRRCSGQCFPLGNRQHFPLSRGARGVSRCLFCGFPLPQKPDLPGGWRVCAWCGRPLDRDPAEKGKP